MSHHPRRTRPVANQVIEPLIPSNARFTKRLIDFDTGYTDLEEQHKAWLRQCMTSIRNESNFYVRLFGYASKLGSAAANLGFANGRLSSVVDFIDLLRHRVAFNRDTYHNDGSAGYKAAANDNSPEWRAVEVHIFTGNNPPSPLPPHVTPINPHVLLGKKWSVSACFSFMVGAGDVPAQFGVSFFRFRNDETSQKHEYYSPMFGAGFDVAMLWKWVKGLRALGKEATIAETVVQKFIKELEKAPRDPLGDLKKAIREIFLHGPSLSNWTSFTPCKVEMPLTFNLLDGATVSSASASLGLEGTSHIEVYKALWPANGKIGTRTLLIVPPSPGWAAQFPTVGASLVGGPLLLL